ncbi:hypothetical protein MNBD_GAMMA03-512 [hydrothermal vent metagenome]|uniref:Uncharacterized protein n=1 Tax=hydrothermal vent metagenome TaxID=652676 RepID=A0A3B0WE66_9ZZZZ
MNTIRYKQPVIKIFFILLLLSITTSGLAVITVGSTNDCDYDNLLDAYNDPDAFVRVTTQLVHSDSFTIAKAKWFTGGYDTCADAESGTLGLFKTKWRRFDDGTVVRINTNNTSFIVIDGFEIFGGRSLDFGAAGGIVVLGNARLLLINSEVYDNEGNEGGGIRARGENVRVTISNSIIRNNTATSFGGGVYCENGATFTMLGESAIKLNTTPGNGGGIFANLNCQIMVQSGDTNALLSNDFGILSNTGSRGGGVYLQGGADMELLGNDTHPASIIGNVSTIDTNNVIIGGGGVYLTGDGTTFTGKNARIDLNIAQNVGAGFGVTTSARFTMERLDAPCWDNDKCSSLANNIVIKPTGDSAAGFIYDQAYAGISQTYIANNQAENTSIMTVSDVGYLRMEGNLIVANGPFNQNFSLRLFRVAGNNGFAGNMDFFYNTLVANNSLVSFYLDGNSSQQHLNIYNSIIQGQGDIISTVGGIDPFLNINCNYVHETASLSVATTLVDTYNLNPEFADSANGDYHLSSDSLAKDLCEEQVFIGIFKDLNGLNRGYDDPNIINLRGPYDAGAYEFNNDLIFSTGFE